MSDNGISAFGVDHGDFSKAVKAPGIGKVSELADSARQFTAYAKPSFKQKASGFKAGFRGVKVGGTSGTVGAPRPNSFNSGIKAGNIARAGAPYAAGGAGVGVAGGVAANRTPDRKKLQQYR